MSQNRKYKYYDEYGQPVDEYGRAINPKTGRNIRIGRQNPLFYEIEEGLEPGEKVITSGYESFKDNEILEF